MSGNLKLNTASSGSISLAPENTASTITVTVPAVTATLLNNSSGVMDIGSGQVYKDASGNVGIGTSSPTQVLDLVRTTAASVYSRYKNSATTNGLLVGVSAAGDSLIYNGDATNLAMYTSGAERARITSSGSLSVPQVNNDTTAAAANLNMQGDGYFRRSTSALKYKQDVRDLENIDINLFRPVRYKSKCDADDQTKDHIGIIADEVAAAGIEELVNRGAEGEVEGFQYERLTVVLLKAIQEQQAIITKLQADVAALQGAA